MKARYTWRKRPGFPSSYGLYRGSDDWLVIVQQDREGRWFWYGGGFNTADNPTDLESAKVEALAMIKNRDCENSSVHGVSHMGEYPSITAYRKLRDEVKSVADSYHSMKACTLMITRPDGTTLTFPLDPLDHFDQIVAMLKQDLKLARDEALEEAVDGE